MKNLFILIFAFIACLTVNAQSYIVECYSCSGPDVNIPCRGCKIETSSFRGLIIRGAGRKDIALYHPVKMSNRGKLITLEDAFGTTFQMSLDKTKNFNTPKQFYNFVETCKCPASNGSTETDWALLTGVPEGFADEIDNVDDADFDPTNEIELPTGGTNGQLLSTDGAGNYSWEDPAAGSASPFTQSITSIQPLNQTHTSIKLIADSVKVDGALIDSEGAVNDRGIQVPGIDVNGHFVWRDECDCAEADGQELVMYQKPDSMFVSYTAGGSPSLLVYMMYGSDATRYVYELSDNAAGGAVDDIMNLRTVYTVRNFVVTGSNITFGSEVEVMTDYSNQDFAWNIKPTTGAVNRNWWPLHSGVKTAYFSSDGFRNIYIDGQLTTASTSGFVKAKVVKIDQRSYFRHPETGTTDHIRRNSTHTFSQDLGYLDTKANMDFLSEMDLHRCYVGMLTVKDSEASGEFLDYYGRPIDSGQRDNVFRDMPLPFSSLVEMNHDQGRAGIYAFDWCSSVSRSCKAQQTNLQEYWSRTIYQKWYNQPFFNEIAAVGDMYSYHLAHYFLP